MSGTIRGKIIFTVHQLAMSRIGDHTRLMPLPAKSDDHIYTHCTYLHHGRYIDDRYQYRFQVDTQHYISVTQLDTTGVQRRESAGIEPAFLKAQQSSSSNKFELLPFQATSCTNSRAPLLCHTRFVRQACRISGGYNSWSPTLYTYTSHFAREIISADGGWGLQTTNSYGRETRRLCERVVPRGEPGPRKMMEENGDKNENGDGNENEVMEGGAEPTK